MKENKNYNDTDRFIDDLTSQFNELSRLSNEDETGNQKLDAAHELPDEHELGDELEQDNTSITSKLSEIMRQVSLEYDQDQESDPDIGNDSKKIGSCNFEVKKSKFPITYSNSRSKQNNLSFDPQDKNQEIQYKFKTPNKTIEESEIFYSDIFDKNTPNFDNIKSKDLTELKELIQSKIPQDPNMRSIMLPFFWVTARFIESQYAKLDKLAKIQLDHDIKNVVTNLSDIQKLSASESSSSIDKLIKIKNSFFATGAEYNYKHLTDVLKRLDITHKAYTTYICKNYESVYLKSTKQKVRVDPSPYNPSTTFPNINDLSSDVLWNTPTFFIDIIFKSSETDFAWDTTFLENLKNYLVLIELNIKFSEGYLSEEMGSLPSQFLKDQKKVNSNKGCESPDLILSSFTNKNTPEARSI